MAKFVIAFTFLAVVASALARPQLDQAILGKMMDALDPKLGDGTLSGGISPVGTAGIGGDADVGGKLGTDDVGVNGKAKGQAGIHGGVTGVVRFNLGASKTRVGAIGGKVVVQE